MTLEKLEQVNTLLTVLMYLFGLVGLLAFTARISLALVDYRVKPECLKVEQSAKTVAAPRTK